MNYRHAYHAGNFADVMKHAALALVVEAMKRKEKPFFALDTHAGTGGYDLWDERAEKTGEYVDGIARVMEAGNAPASLTPYLNVVRGLNPQGGLRWYPGSPEVVRALMRENDRLAAAELHPEDGAALRGYFAGDRRVAVHLMDGYTAAKGLLPPPERRGLVLLDPPFESRDELDRLAASLSRINRLWPTGTVMAWYPIKGREPVDAFHAALAQSGRPKTLAAELLRHPDDNPFRLNGSGLIIVNPPWTLVDQLREMLSWMEGLLTHEGGGWRVSWLVEEIGRTP